MHRQETSGSAPAREVQAKALTRFEGHCLCRRTRECEELLQLAVLGVEQMQERHVPDHDLAEIARHLAAAERHVGAARRLTVRWSD